MAEEISPEIFNCHIRWRPRHCTARVHWKGCNFDIISYGLRKSFRSCYFGNFCSYGGSIDCKFEDIADARDEE